MSYRVTTSASRPRIRSVGDGIASVDTVYTVYSNAPQAVAVPVAVQCNDPGYYWSAADNKCLPTCAVTGSCASAITVAPVVTTPVVTTPVVTTPDATPKVITPTVTAPVQVQCDPGYYWSAADNKCMPTCAVTGSCASLTPAATPDSTPKPINVGPQVQATSKPVITATAPNTPVPAATVTTSSSYLTGGILAAVILLGGGAYYLSTRKGK